MTINLVTVHYFLVVTPAHFSVITPNMPAIIVNG